MTAPRRRTRALPHPDRAAAHPRRAARAASTTTTAWRRSSSSPIGELSRNASPTTLVRGSPSPTRSSAPSPAPTTPPCARTAASSTTSSAAAPAHWDVPVGGMGALTDALAGARRGPRARELATGAEVVPRSTRTATRRRCAYRRRAARARRGPARPGQRLARSSSPPARRRAAGPRRGRPAQGQHAAHAPAAAARQRRRPARGVRRDLPRRRGLRPAGDAPAPRRRPAACPPSPPSEIYCHSLTDPTHPRPRPRRPRRPDAHPVRPAHSRPAVRRDNDAARDERSRPTLPSSTPSSPSPCRLPVARRRRPPLHRGEDPARPGARARPARRQHLPPRPDLAVRRERPSRPLGRGDRHANVLLCGAGAGRGGGVSGVPGHNAAMAVLGGG